MLKRITYFIGWLVNLSGVVKSVIGILLMIVGSGLAVAFFHAPQARPPWMANTGALVAIAGFGLLAWVCASAYERMIKWGTDVLPLAVAVLVVGVIVALVGFFFAPLTVGTRVVGGTIAYVGLAAFIAGRAKEPRTAALAAMLFAFAIGTFSAAVHVKAVRSALVWYAYAFRDGVTFATRAFSDAAAYWLEILIGLGLLVVGIWLIRYRKRTLEKEFWDELHLQTANAVAAGHRDTSTTTKLIFDRAVTAFRQRHALSDAEMADIIQRAHRRFGNSGAAHSRASPKPE
jgi:hypothetical protein